MSTARLLQNINMKQDLRYAHLVASPFQRSRRRKTKGDPTRAGGGLDHTHTHTSTRATTLFAHPPSPRGLLLLLLLLPLFFFFFSFFFSLLSSLQRASNTHCQRKTPLGAHEKSQTTAPTLSHHTRKKKHSRDAKRVYLFMRAYLARTLDHGPEIV